MLIIKICCSITALVDTTNIPCEVLNGFLPIYRNLLNKYLLEKESFEEEGDEARFS